MSSPSQRHGIFLCYRREDSEDFASRLYDELAEKFGHPRVFKDVDSLLPGFDWEEHLRARLAEAAIVIVLIGPDWSDCTDATGHRRLEAPEDHVRTEVESALAERIPVIPLLIGQTRLPERTTLPESIRALVRRQSFAIRRDQHFRPDVRLFIENLERIFEALAAKAPSTSASDPVTAAVVSSAAAAAPPATSSTPVHTTAPVTPPPSSAPTMAAHDSPGKSGGDAWKLSEKLAPFVWCGWWYLASLLLPVPGLGAWWQAKLLRQRAPSVQAWWPASSLSPAIAFFLFTLAHDLASDSGQMDLLYWFAGVTFLVIFLPQWALLQAARVRLAWLWMVVPVIAFSISGFMTNWGLYRHDMNRAAIIAWLLEGAIMGPLLYWQTRGQVALDTAQD